MTTSFQIGAALSMLLLGLHSTDCPPNCPGTDAGGRRRAASRTVVFPALAFIGIAAVWTFCTGCTSPNPLADPASPSEPAYVVATNFPATSNAVMAAAEAAGAATGTGPLLPLAAQGALVIFAAISAYVARRKSQLAGTLAAAIHDQGTEAVANAIAYAADSGCYGGVCSELNKHTATGQAPGQPTQPTTP